MTCEPYSHISTLPVRRRTLTVSFPIPSLPPVTIITRPLKSGISSVDHLGGGGNMDDQPEGETRRAEDASEGSA